MTKRNPRKSKNSDNLRSASPKSAPLSPEMLWLYGIHTVLAALRNPDRRIKRIVATKSAADRFRNYLKGFEDLEIVNRDAIEDLLPPGAVHQGVALLATSPEQPAFVNLIHEVSGPACVVVLDQVNDPQNVGSIMRSAAAFGADALIVQDRHAPRVTGALAKTASGSLEIIPMLRVPNLTRALNTLKAASFWCIGLDGSAETLLPDMRLDGRIALVMGAENSGLRRLTRQGCDTLARLPTTEGFGTLNVAAAATVALYEAARQRNT